MAQPLVSIDDKELKRLEESLRKIPGAIGRVIPRGINKTADKANTDLIAAVHEETGLQKKIIRRSILKRRATKNRYQADVDASAGRRIPLINFSKSKRIPKNQKGGFRYKMRGESQLIPYNKITSPVFKTKMKTGHIGVFRRIKHGTSQRIIELFGPSVPQIINSDDPGSFASIINQTAQKSAPLLEKNIAIQIGLEIERQLAKK